MLATRLSLLLIFIAATPGGLLGADSSRGPDSSEVPSTDLRPAPANGLPTSDGRTISLVMDVGVQLQVICFLGTECPLAKVYGPRLQRMADKYADRGVQFIGINSNIQDSMEDLRRYVSQHQIKFPVAKDYDRTVALAMQATRTPEVFVIGRGGGVRYRGRIDDQYRPGIARSEATVHNLRDAIDQLLAGESVRTPRTEAVGCLISLPRESAADPKAKVTFCNQVIRVLQRHCVECHREGEIGPFVLDDYDEAIGWADMSVEVIDEGRMPPWHADPKHGSFANSRYMPEIDKQILRQWVEAGTPYGNADDLPPKMKHVRGWRLPVSPDAVYTMSDRPFQVPAEGTVEYQYFVVYPGFTEDKWVAAVEVVPGNRAVVHHSIAFIRPPDGAEFRDFGILAAYVPGQGAGILPKGFAMRVQAGSKLVFQMHYTPTGKPESDNTRIGLVFAEPKDVTHEVYTLGGIEQEFEIPPHADNYQVHGQISGVPREVPKDGLLLTIAPHMHLRGKSFQLTAETDTGREVLLSVPSYDFNWQHSYELETPLPLDSVNSLDFSATFDNSSGNPFNPDPTEFVTWGDQTWQEMAVAFITVARPIKAKRPAAEEVEQPTQPSEAELRRQRELWDRAQQQAQEYITRRDKDENGELTRRELPHAVSKYGYLDHNWDGRVTKDELANEFHWRLQR